MGLFFSDDSSLGTGRIPHRHLDKHLRGLGIEKEHRENVIQMFDEHRNGREYITGKDIQQVMKRIKNNHEDGMDQRHVSKIHDHLLGLVGGGATQQPEQPDHSDLHFKN